MAPAPQFPDPRQVMDAVLAALEQPENVFEQMVQSATGVTPPPGPVKTLRAILQRAPGPPALPSPAELAKMLPTPPLPFLGGAAGGEAGTEAGGEVGGAAAATEAGASAAPETSAEAKTAEFTGEGY